MRKSPSGKDRLLHLGSGVWDLQVSGGCQSHRDIQREAMLWYGFYLGIFSQEHSGAEGTSSPRQTESAEGLERAVLASRGPTNLFHPFGVRLRPGL